MENFEDDLPFDKNDDNYRKDIKKTINNIENLINKMDNQNSIESIDFLYSIERYLEYRLRYKKTKNSFNKIEELVQFLDNYMGIPVYGKWDDVPNEYTNMIYQVIKKHLQNGIIREIELTVETNGSVVINISGFGEYEKAIRKDNNGRLIQFKIIK